MNTDDVTLIATGPLTNIACAIHREPRIVERVKELSIMGGSVTFGNWTPTAEFNIFVDPEAAYKVFFRYNVKKGNDIVTLREELELIDHYIYILNVRFSGDIHYGKEIEEDLLDSCMPSMILQPIVENSVNHGIREMNGEGKIRLKVYHVDGDTLGISIRDNGIGMDPDTIEKVLGGNYHEEQSGGGSNGIAMGNVIARLKLFTQNEDVMTILSDGKDQGTEVILYLPIKEREKTDV